MATATVTVEKARATQEDLLVRREHCAVSSAVLAALGVGPGQQVRIRRGDEFALYTVSEVLDVTDGAAVRMGLGGRRRLHTDSGFAAVVDTKVVDAGLDDAEAAVEGELVERILDDGTQTELVVVAPHGGDIEGHTDEQAARVVQRLGTRRASVWWCSGWRSGGGAFDRWHVTSTDLAAASFPLLETISARRFTHAVAFHGFDDEPGVLVGGTAPATTKARVVRAVAGVLPAGLGVRVARADEHYGGDDPGNVVNRLSRRGGIQLEQGPLVRAEHGPAVADAVADVLGWPWACALGWMERHAATVSAGLEYVIERARSAPLRGMSRFQPPTIDR